MHGRSQQSGTQTPSLAGWISKPGKALPGEHHSAIKGTNCRSLRGGALQVSCWWKTPDTKSSLFLKLWMRQNPPRAGGAQVGGDLGLWVTSVAWEGAWRSLVVAVLVSCFRGLILKCICQNSSNGARKCLCILGQVRYFPLF